MADKSSTGRPTDYNDDVAASICAELADGKSLRTICAADGMPDKATVFRWIAKHEVFRDQYALARATQADALFDELIDIADDGSNDWMERKNADGQNIGWTENGEALRRSVLRVDARKWVVSKLLPKKYGERITNVVEGGEKPLEVTDTSPRDLAKAMALIVAKGLKDGSGA